MFGLYVMHSMVSSLGVIASRRVFEVGFDCTITVNAWAQGTVLLLGWVMLRRRGVPLVTHSKQHAFVGMTTILTHTLGHLPYKFLGVGFIQVLKMLTPVVVMIVVWIHRIDVPNRPRLWTMLGMTASASVIVVRAERFHFGGVILMLTSSIADAYRLGWTQTLWTDGPVELMTATALWATIFATPCAAIELILWPPNVSAAGLVWCSITGVVACVINLLTIRIVHDAGSASLKLVGVGRNAIIVVVSSIWYAEWLSLVEFVAYASTIGFAAIHVWQSSYSRSVGLLTSPPHHR